MVVFAQAGQLLLNSSLVMISDQVYLHLMLTGTACISALNHMEFVFSISYFCEKRSN